MDSSVCMCRYFIPLRTSQIMILFVSPFFWRWRSVVLFEHQLLRLKPKVLRNLVLACTMKKNVWQKCTICIRRYMNFSRLVIRESVYSGTSALLFYSIDVSSFPEVRRSGGRQADTISKVASIMDSNREISPGKYRTWNVSYLSVL